MTPKEKAEELVHRYDLMQTYVEGFGLEDAKQCALIAVDEILKDDIHEDAIVKRHLYWQEVKQEMENL